MTSAARKLCILALAVLMVACSGKDGGDKRDATANSAGVTPADQGLVDDAELPLARRLERIGRLTERIVAEANALPRAEFDPAGLVAATRKDPQKLFEWVRDRTWWAPYRGVLRGPRGVMLDRVGSSLDRALLLGDLLRQAGCTVRLAHAELSEGRAGELLGQVRPIPAQRRAAVAPQATSDEQPQFAESSRIQAEAKALASSQSEALLAAVHAAAHPESPDDKAAIAALRDHWWIERNEDGRWIAMDVLLPTAQVGDTSARAAAISAWPNETAWPSIPEAQWQSVRLRVVVERYDAGATTESTLLEAMLRPAEQVGQPITLGHMPLPWPEGLQVPADPRVLRDSALAVRDWVPYLAIGGQLVVQSGFSIQGDIRSNPLEASGLAKAGGAEQAGNIASALGGFGGEEAGPAATAEWLDVEIHVPGATPQRLRRQIFDLLGPARRASKAADFNGTADLRKLERFEALFSQTDLMLQASDYTDEFVASLISAGIVANRSALIELSRTTDPARVRSLAAEIADRITPWGPLPNLALWRSTLMDQSADVFLDRPNVLSYRVGQAVVSTDKPVIRTLVDIAANGTGVRRGAARGTFEVRLRQGVTDTVAEMLTLGSDLRMAENTASIFARLAAEGSRGLLIPARDLGTASTLPWPEDEAARVGADVSDGFIALVPRKAVTIDGQERVGWWRVDPASGETIGVMDNGFHAAAAEDTMVRAREALKSLQQYVRNNVGHMRKVVQNPNAFPANEVKLYRDIFRVLKDVKDLGGL